MAVTLNALTTGVGGLQTTGDTSGSISLQSNGSTVLAVTSGGAAVTGTMTVGGNAVLNAGTAVTIAQGGTGQTTANAAYNALSPMTTTGDIEYRTAGSVAARLGIGTTGQLLSVVGGIPAWATVSSTPTTAQVQTAIAGSAAGDLGTYAMAISASAGFSVNTNYAGSGLTLQGFVVANSLSFSTVQSGGTGSTLSGTWKAMMTSNNVSANVWWTLFLRVV